MSKKSARQTPTHGKIGGKDSLSKARKKKGAISQKVGLVGEQSSSEKRWLEAERLEIDTR